LEARESLVPKALEICARGAEARLAQPEDVLRTVCGVLNQTGAFENPQVFGDSRPANRQAAGVVGWASAGGALGGRGTFAAGAGVVQPINPSSTTASVDTGINRRMGKPPSQGVVQELDPSDAEHLRGRQQFGGADLAQAGRPGIVARASR
jgi:hypothetical protein